MNVRPTTPAEVQAAVKTYPCLAARGGGSKPALSTPAADVPVLEMAGLSGILEYEPDEFTFTALAGTTVAEVEEMLTEHGQYLPFDPLLAGRGATLGGTVAANTGGPGRYRYGGVRDFILGVRFVDGQGNLVRGGGKVVKNSAGFDLPKLMVGSLGRLGVLVELTFKVFPGPEAYATVRFDCARLEEALAALYRLATSTLECQAIDITPAGPAGPASLWVRLGGLTDALPARIERLQDFLGGGQALDGPGDARLWQEVREMAWVPPGWALVKVPITPRRVPALEEKLQDSPARRRYSVGGNVAWLAWPDGLEPAGLTKILTSLDLAGLVLFGPAGRPYLGDYPGQALARRVKQALDPAGRFLEVA